MEFIHIQMVQNIKANGKMINSMVKEFNPGQMDLNTKDNIIQEKRMEKGNLYGVTIHIIKDNFHKITFRDLAHISGQMEENLLVLGLKIECMGKEYSLGLMEENIKEIMYKI